MKFRHDEGAGDFAGSIGYSGQPLDILVAVTRDARIAGARLVRHNEPILTLGLSDADIEAFVSGFQGLDLADGLMSGATPNGLPEIISRATVSSGVMRDAILRTARTVAVANGLIGGGRVNVITFRAMDWADLAASGALANQSVTLDEARSALAEAERPPPPGTAPFIDLWAALIDPPTIGRNLLGQHEYSSIIAKLAPGQSALFVASRGRSSKQAPRRRHVRTIDARW